MLYLRNILKPRVPSIVETVTLIATQHAIVGPGELDWAAMYEKAPPGLPSESLARRKHRLYTKSLFDSFQRTRQFNLFTVTS